MRRFARLYETLDQTTSTNAKVQAMAAYFADAPPADAAWAAHLLAGRRLKRVIGPAELRRWLHEAAPFPEWLVEETYAAVGDLAETIALLMDEGRSATDDDRGLADWVEAGILPLASAEPEARRERVVGWWRTLDARRLFVLNKLLTGAFRVGVSQTLVARALAEASGLPKPVIQHRLMGRWKPSADSWRRLVDPAEDDADEARPYPFFLASPLADDPALLGPRGDWQAEWKWDGIRAQLVRRGGQSFLWSRGEELVTDRYPELTEAAERLPDGTVLDGEILAWSGTGVAPFSMLQKRIGRKRVTAKLLEAVPVRFLAYDLLESAGRDVRGEPLAFRRDALERLLAGTPEAFGVSPVVDGADWDALARLRESSRERGVEGLMLKARDSQYGTGRTRGAWWKWKIDPYTVDAVMLYAQPGHGRRASLYTDYTFGVWRGEELVPVAKAYSGLSDEEIVEVDRWIRQNTTERYGPVRAVRPAQVFELAFEGINASSRHKSGVALRFPRIARWRRDLAPKDAETLAEVRSLLAPEERR